MHSIFLIALSILSVCEPARIPFRHSISIPEQIQQKLANGSFSGIIFANPLKKDFASEDAISPGADHNEKKRSLQKRLSRQMRDHHYESDLVAAPSASELLEMTDLSVPDPEVIINEIPVLTTSAPVTAQGGAVVPSDQNDMSHAGGRPLGRRPSAEVQLGRRPSAEVQAGRVLPVTVEPRRRVSLSGKEFTFVSQGSVYINLGHGRKTCERNSDCYNMREPDEWCQAIANPQITYDRGCICDHNQHYCLVERKNQGVPENSDCSPKEISKCDT